MGHHICQIRFATTSVHFEEVAYVYTQIEDILVSTVGFTFSFYAVQTHELLHSDRTLVQKTRQALELLGLQPSCDRITSEFPNWVQILGPISSLKAVLPRRSIVRYKDNVRTPYRFAVTEDHSTSQLPLAVTP